MFNWGHNPYFNRWFSAIKQMLLQFINQTSHNPYFNRWFSAIEEMYGECDYIEESQSLF